MSPFRPGKPNSHAFWNLLYTCTTAKSRLDYVSPRGLRAQPKSNEVTAGGLLTYRTRVPSTWFGGSPNPTRGRKGATMREDSHARKWQAHYVLATSDHQSIAEVGGRPSTPRRAVSHCQLFIAEDEGASGAGKVSQRAVVEGGRRQTWASSRSSDRVSSARDSLDREYGRRHRSRSRSSRRRCRSSRSHDMSAALPLSRDPWLGSTTQGNTVGLAVGATEVVQIGARGSQWSGLGEVQCQTYQRNTFAQET